MRLGQWRSGNHVQLIENGEQFYPRVFEAIGEARREVLVETFIVAYDAIGRLLQRALMAAARRGVRTELTIDGYGSAPLPPHFIRAMTDAGVQVRVFDPRKRLFGWRTNLFRRLHRKLVVIDGVRAFVGGINFSRDHVDTPAKQDYAVEVTGPVVAEIHETARAADDPRPLPPTPQPAGKMRAMFAVRDNERHHNDIELLYRLAFRRARRYIIVANAYFFPGFRLIRELYAAARRGVRVELITQGNPDQPLVRKATEMLYDDMAHAGIMIHEFRDAPLHAKVAVVDDRWATVGSSNLDPLSLFLNIEANVVVRNRGFATMLQGHLRELIEARCNTVRRPGRPRRRTLWRRLLAAIAFHAARRFPRWAGWLPGRRDSLAVPFEHAPTAEK